MYILDTHTLLWFLEDSEKLPLDTRIIVENSTDVSVSIVSLWEIAIKVNIGKLTISLPIEIIMEALDSLSIGILPLTERDLSTYVNLPLNHRDPFDRMIISQAMVRKASIVSKDSRFDEYSPNRIWV